ncbi:MAG: glycogen/starch synthase [Crocinitomicaceae bacterium]|nr:glycogen/starch synthase [Crocinitomicaceae bacterium]
MDKTRVLFVSQEILPFSPESSIAESARQIPQAVHERGKETRIFMPRYGKINERRHQLHEVIRLSGMNIILDDTDHPLIIKVASIPQIRLQVYFIDNEEFFHRKAIFHNENEELFPDNDLRMIFFAKGVLETVKKLGWAPDIIHCHGWFTSLLPMYVKKLFSDDPHYTDSKVVFSLYDDKFSGTLDKKLSKKVSFDNIPASDMGDLAFPSHDNLMKLGIQYADGIIINDKNTSPEVEEYLIESGIPILRQYEEADPLTAIDEFFDSVHAGKSVLID